MVIITSTVEFMKMMRTQLRMKVCCGNECKPACSTAGGGNLPPQLLQLLQLLLLLLPLLLVPACCKAGGWTLDTPAASPDPLPHLCALLCFARHHLSFFEAAYLSLLQLHNWPSVHVPLCVLVLPPVAPPDHLLTAKYLAWPQIFPFHEILTLPPARLGRSLLFCLTDHDSPVPPIFYAFMLLYSFNCPCFSFSTSPPHPMLLRHEILSPPFPAKTYL